MKMELDALIIVLIITALVADPFIVIWFFIILFYNLYFMMTLHDGLQNHVEFIFWLYYLYFLDIFKLIINIYKWLVRLILDLGKL